ncbi:MAG: acetolactate synthase small subunit [Spirochaetales bacterium]|nr:acetolactate synthase small subunit [Spirochaetales bacterium]
MNNRVLYLLVQNHQGVLARISGLLSGRGYNVESFTAGRTNEEGLTRITLVCRGDDSIIDQVKKQLNKIIDIVKVVDLSERPTVDRELALIKVAAKPGERGELFQLADIFKATVKDVGTTSIVLEITGSTDEVDDLLLLLDGQVLELARSGLVSMERGKKETKEIF